MAEEMFRFVLAPFLKQEEKEKAKKDFESLERAFLIEIGTPREEVALFVPPLPAQTLLLFKGKELVGYTVFNLEQNTLRLNRQYLKPEFRTAVLQGKPLRGQMVKKIADTLELDYKQTVITYYRAKKRKAVARTLDQFLHSEQPEKRPDMRERISKIPVSIRGIPAKEKPKGGLAGLAEGFRRRRRR